MKQKELLIKVLAERKSINHRYNLSSLARDIKISQSKLWKVIYGGEFLSVEQAYHLGNTFKLAAPDIFALMEESLINKKIKKKGELNEVISYGY